MNLSQKRDHNDHAFIPRFSSNPPALWAGNPAAHDLTLELEKARQNVAVTQPAFTGIVPMLAHSHGRQNAATPDLARIVPL